MTRVRALAKAGLLQGLPRSPNTLAEEAEYREPCEFAARNGAAYVSDEPAVVDGPRRPRRRNLASPAEQMRRIAELTAPFAGQNLEIVTYPASKRFGLRCWLLGGNDHHVFAAGEVTVCPYLYSPLVPRPDEPASSSSATSPPTPTSPADWMTTR